MTIFGCHLEPCSPRYEHFWLPCWFCSLRYDNFWLQCWLCSPRYRDITNLGCHVGPVWGNFSLFSTSVATECMVTKSIMSKCISVLTELQFQVTRDRANAPRPVVSEVSLCHRSVFQIAQMYNSHANRLRARTLRISAGRFGGPDI